MKIAICDDNQDYTSYLRALVCDYFSSCNTKLPDIITYLPEELTSYLASRGCNYDIFILNTYFKHSSGIDTAKMINKMNPNSIIIYISDSIHATEKIYETSHIYFILKQNVERFLPKALSKAEHILFERKRNSYIS